MPAQSITQLTVTLTGGAGTVTVPVPAGMTADGIIADIFKHAGFWESTQTTFYPVSQIQSITAS